MRQTFLTALALCALAVTTASAVPANFEMTGKKQLLWPEGAPGATGTGQGHEPSLTIYLPEASKATGTAIVVCPGGGYGGLAIDHEGEQIGQWLIKEGIAAFVLQYRHAPLYGQPFPLMDSQRAIRTVRAGAAAWGVKPDRIGILGFSAGGHLTASTGVLNEGGDASAKDPIDQVSARPDFMVPVYPVITMQDDYTHQGSKKNLLGENPDPALVERYSLERQVNAQTPPTFLVHTTDDQAVPVENAVQLYLALHKAGVPVEMHIYEKGVHGLGLGGGNAEFATWPGHLIDWLKVRGLLSVP
jgi:acetyl esterase/lipase